MKKALSFIFAVIMVLQVIPFTASAITYDDFDTTFSAFSNMNFEYSATNQMNQSVNKRGAYQYYLFSPEAGTYNNNQLYFTIKPTKFAMSDYPYIKVSYIADTGSDVIDVSINSPKGENWLKTMPETIESHSFSSFIVSLDDFTGNGKVSAPEVGERDITLKIKPFGAQSVTLDGSESFELNYVAFFKTRAEAEAFTYNENGLLISYSNNIITAEALFNLLGSSTYTSMTDFCRVTEDESYIRYTVAPGTYNNNLMILVKHGALSFTEYPYVKICYRTDSPKTVLDTTITSENGENWASKHPALYADGEFHTEIVNINAMNAVASKIPNPGSMNITLRFKPWGTSNTVISENSYFDIKYVAMFKTINEAVNFTYTGDSDYPFDYYHGADNFSYNFASNELIAGYIEEADARTNEVIHTNNTVPYEDHLAFSGITGAYTGDYKESAYVLSAKKGTLGKTDGIVTFTQNDVSYRDFPYVKIGYMSDSDYDLGASYTIGNDNIIDLSGESTVSKIELYPFGTGSRTLSRDMSFSIDYIGLFKTRAEAEAYEYKGEHADNMTDTHVIYTANILDPDSTAEGTVHFISSSTGNDNNDGKTPATAWKTVAKLMQEKPTGTVYFKRGDSFRYEGTINAVKYTVYTSYGYGAKPKLIASIDGTGAGNWEATSDPNIWRFKTKITNNTQQGDVGHIRIKDKDGNELWGIKVSIHNTDENRVDNGYVYNGRTYIDPLCVPVDGGLGLYNDLEFYHDYSSGYVYLYCEDGNPGEVFESVEIADKGNAVSNTSYTTFDNLYLTGAGSHGLGGGERSMTVSNCHLEWIGGSIQVKQLGSTMPLDPVRFGNAIEIYGNAYDFTIKNCYATNIYDCCYTVQNQEEREFKNIYMFDSVASYSNTGLEVWKSGGITDNMHLFDNYTLFGGYGWSHQRPLKDGNFFYGGGTNNSVYTNCSVDNNVNVLATSVGLLVGDISSARYNFNNNVYIMGENITFTKAPADTEHGSGALANIPFNYENLKAVIARGTEAGSEFYFAPTDGLAIGDDPHNYFAPGDNPISEVWLDDTGIMLSVGRKYSLKVNTYPKNSDDELYYSSKNPSIASVDKNGVITAKSAGQTTVSVYSVEKGAQAEIEVTVFTNSAKQTLISTNSPIGDSSPVTVEFIGDGYFNSSDILDVFEDNYHITLSKKLSDKVSFNPLRYNLDSDIVMFSFGYGAYLAGDDPVEVADAFAEAVKDMRYIKNGANIVYVSPYNVTSEKNTVGYTPKDYVDAIKSACEKVGVPVADVFGATENTPVLVSRDGVAGQIIPKYIDNSLTLTDKGVKLCEALLVSSLVAADIIDTVGQDGYPYRDTANDFTALGTADITASGTVTDGDNTYYRFVPVKNLDAAKDNSYITLELKNNQFKLREYPVMKIYYRAKIKDPEAELDINYIVKKDGENTRLWINPKYEYGNPGELTSVTIDLSTVSTGGDKITSLSAADADTPVVALRIKPYNLKSMDVKDYFDVLSVSFYSSIEEADKDGKKEADPIISKGDIDANGEVELSDNVYLARHFANWNGYGELPAIEASDLSYDGYVDITDFIVYSRYLAGWLGYEDILN